MLCFPVEPFLLLVSLFANFPFQSNVQLTAERINSFFNNLTINKIEGQDNGTEVPN